MDEHSVAFLQRLLATASPSGDEVAAARVWREEAATFADQVTTDVRGSTLALLNGGAPRVLLAGHIDEIGLMITYIDDDGFLSFSTIGGWDTQVLVGQRVRLLGHAGEVVGVIGKKPIHLMKGDEREQASKIENLWIDIGATSREDARERVRVGASGVIDATVQMFPNQRVVARGLDNRIGAFTVLEALRLLAQDRPQATVAAVATSQEEITFAGAYTSAFSFEPQVAIVVDVTFATDHPEMDKRRNGDVKLGGGPVLERGSANSPVVYELLLSAAEQHSIPYSLAASPSYTGTDADAIALSRGGVATGVVSIPNRYMHSPNEMIDLRDVAHAAQLIAAFVRALSAETNLLPH